MKRREFITFLGSIVATWPLAVRAQGLNPPRVGYLFTSKKAEGQGLWEACRQGLRELGYREGENITLEPRWTEGDQERLPDLVKELLGLNVAILVTAATPASLAQKLLQTRRQLCLLPLQTRSASDSSHPSRGPAEM